MSEDVSSIPDELLLQRAVKGARFGDFGKLLDKMTAHTDRALKCVDALKKETS